MYFYEVVVTHTPTRKKNTVLVFAGSETDAKDKLEAVYTPYEHHSEVIHSYEGGHIVIELPQEEKNICYFSVKGATQLFV